MSDDTYTMTPDERSIVAWLETYPYEDMPETIGHSIGSDGIEQVAQAIREGAHRVAKTCPNCNEPIIFNDQARRWAGDLYHGRCHAEMAKARRARQEQEHRRSEATRHLATIERTTPDEDHQPGPNDALYWRQP